MKNIVKLSKNIPFETLLRELPLKKCGSPPGSPNIIPSVDTQLFVHGYMCIYISK